MTISLTMKSGVATIEIYNDISQGFGFSLQDLRDALKTLPKNTKLIIRLGSDGGDVFQGLGIYNLLRQWEGEVTTICDSIAASIASVIFLAGDVRQIADNAFLMTHSSAVTAFGAQEAGLADLLELVKKANENIRNIYTERTKASVDTVKSWMEGDNWFTAQEALEAGFATEIVEIGKLVKGANFVSLAAKLSLHNGVKTMFEKWLKEHCETLGLDASKLTDEQRTKLEAVYNKTLATPPPRKPKTEPIDDDAKLTARREKEAAEDERIEGIRAAAENFDDEDLNEEYLKTLKCRRKTVRGVCSYAISNGWSVDKFELEMMRAKKDDVGHIGIHPKESLTGIFKKPLAMSCAILRSTGVAANSVHRVTGKKYGYEHWYNEETLEASENPEIRDASLCQLLEHHIIAATGSRYRGRLNTDGFIAAVRDAQYQLRASGNTTWSGLNIFDDAANKMLWAAYEAQNTTWQEWVKVASVSDFKIHNAYRLTSKGGYQQVGADGELKHGGFSDQKFTHSAETYGKIVGLNRRDIINDDLGALNGIMTALGEEGAKFLEELFYVHLLNQLATLFPTNNANLNYLDGTGSDLGVDGLTAAENQLSNMVDADNSPILIEASLLLHGVQDTVLANELYKESSLDVLQTANAKGRPNKNPHVGKYRPVQARYLSNTNIKQRITNLGQAIPNQTANQWLLVRPAGPMGGIVIGSFLNGQQRPTIQQGDAAFEVLGLQWRAFHDAGADNGDPKWAQYNKGAA